MEKEQKKHPKIRRRKQIIYIRAEINEKEMKEIIVKINKTKSWFFEKINKIDKPLARLIKLKKGRRDQVNKIRNEKNPQQNSNNRIQQHIKKFIHSDQLGLFQGCKDSSIYANQSM